MRTQVLLTFLVCAIFLFGKTGCKQECSQTDKVVSILPGEKDRLQIDTSCCGRSIECKFQGAWFSEDKPIVLHVSEDSIVFFNLDGFMPLSFKGVKPECGTDYLFLEEDIHGNSVRLALIPIRRNKLYVTIISSGDTADAGLLYRGVPDAGIKKVVFFPNCFDDSLAHVDLDYSDTISIWSSGNLAKLLPLEIGTMRALTEFTSVETVMQLDEENLIDDERQYCLRIIADSTSKELQFSYSTMPSELIEIALFLEWIYMKDTAGCNDL